MSVCQDNRIEAMRRSAKRRRISQEFILVVAFVGIIGMSAWISFSGVFTLQERYQTWARQYNACRDDGGSVQWCAVGLK